eukprot:1358527-Rhodomonas_salina.1
MQGSEKRRAGKRAGDTGSGNVEGNEGIQKGVRRLTESTVRPAGWAGSSPNLGMLKICAIGST